MINVNFPQELLKCSIEDRVNYFYKEIIEHRNLKIAKERLLESITLRSTPIISLYGPTRVGKSTLLRIFCREYFKQLKETSTIEPGTIPVVVSEVIPPTDGKFSWTYFYKQLLRDMEEPLVNEKIQYTDTIYRNSDGRLITKSNTNQGDLRYALEKAFFYRKVNILILEEAQHFGNISGSAAMKNQMETIKSLANRTETKIVLVGTYDLVPLLDTSDQLATRSNNINFPEYRFDIQDDVDEFGEILCYLFGALPMANQKDFTESHFELFFERSLGCIGLLHDWLHKALQHTLKRNPDAKTITLKTFEECSISAAQGMAIASSITTGQSQLNKSSWNDVRMHIGYKINENKFLDDNPQIAKQESIPKGRRLSPGERKAKRDPVGINQDVI